MNQDHDQVVENPMYMFVGEAWDKDEALQKKPFVGRAGMQLTRMLQGAGIERFQECYITNIMNERPPKNNFGVYYEDDKRTKPKQVLIDGWNAVLEKVERLQPKVVIPLGDEPLKVFLGVNHQGIECHQGSVYIQDAGIPIMPTFHPSAILRSGGASGWYFPTFIMNMKRAKRVVQGEKPLNPKIYSQAVGQVLYKLFKESKMPVAFDIEWTYKTGERITCISFAQHKETGYVVSFLDQTEDLALYQEKLKWVRAILEDPDIPKVGQNAYNADIPMIKRCWGIKVVNYVHDTMFAHMALHPEFPHDLGYLTSQYTMIPYYKHMSETDLLNYNGLDSCATIGVYYGQRQEMENRKLLERYQNYWHRMLDPLREMYERGIVIDTEYQKEYKDELKQQIRDKSAELNQFYASYTDRSHLDRSLYRWELLYFLGRKTVKMRNKKGKIARRNVESKIKEIHKQIQKLGELNVRSSKQLAQFLYVTLGLPKKTRQGKVTTDETALNQLFIKTNHEFLKKILELRGLENNMSKYGNLKMDENNRVHTTYKLVETGRLSSGQYSAK